LKHLLDVVASRSHALRGMPKYAALYHGLVGAIESGVWKPGDQLPPEDVIARGVNLSLGTVQRALRMLADEGIVVRQHGRGTFVAGVEGRREQVRHYRFLADDGLTVLPLYSRTLAIREVPGEGAVADFFTPESRLIEIRRIINVNLEFQCLDTIFLSAARFPGFLEMRPNELDGVSLNYELDTLEPGSVGLQWETLGYTYRDAPLFFQHCFLPPSRRRLLIDGSGPAGSRSLV
jgi:DNA-binding GntR family transcriptional regulator